MRKIVTGNLGESVTPEEAEAAHLEELHRRYKEVVDSQGITSENTLHIYNEVRSGKAIEMMANEVDPDVAGDINTSPSDPWPKEDDYARARENGFDGAIWQRGTPDNSYMVVWEENGALVIPTQQRWWGPGRLGLPAASEVDYSLEEFEDDFQSLPVLSRFLPLPSKFYAKRLEYIHHHANPPPNKNPRIKKKPTYHNIYPNGRFTVYQSDQVRPTYFATGLGRTKNSIAIPGLGVSFMRVEVQFSAGRFKVFANRLSAKNWKVFDAYVKTLTKKGHITKKPGTIPEIFPLLPKLKPFINIGGPQFSSDDEYEFVDSNAKDFWWVHPDKQFRKDRLESWDEVEDALNELFDEEFASWNRLKY
jgi:hypothetical protein